VKAAVLESIPGELIIDDIQIGSVGPHEVLVHTTAAGLCHSDLHFMEGKYPHPVPTVLGHESAGVVEAVGSQVSYVQPGDHVISCISGFCGACRY
jgi:S-(hydroxymethyl)glutathione dehydrogenase/alcohol dehydrogenase